MFSSFRGEMTLKSSQSKTNTLPSSGDNFIEPFFKATSLFIRLKQTFLIKVNVKTLMKLITGSEKSFKLTKSSTLPSGGKGRPEIGRPILQAATPSAASLISKAASTGVPQHSILASNHKNDK
jgi:hypothetical protein